MIRSPQRRTILCIYETVVPASSGKPPVKVLKSLAPEMVGLRCGQVVIASAEVQKRGRHHFVYTRCETCRQEKWINIDSLRRGTTNGCQRCSQPRQIPKWLDRRLTAARQRCTNPDDPAYPSYGGRGIQFQFESVLQAGLWVMENLNLHRDMELDRIDNNGHYAPGNLRWVPQQVNTGNRGNYTRMKLLEFREEHPHIRYADNTLMRFLRQGMTFAQIAERWNLPSTKPKGVYGTFSTPDPDTVSLLREGWSRTVGSAAAQTAT